MKCNHEKLVCKIKGINMKTICPKCGKVIIKGRKIGGGAFGFPKRLRNKEV